MFRMSVTLYAHTVDTWDMLLEQNKHFQMFVFFVKLEEVSDILTAKSAFM